jgi:hypothetical protein
MFVAVVKEANLPVFNHESSAVWNQNRHRLIERHSNGRIAVNDGSDVGDAVTLPSLPSQLSWFSCC